MLALVFARCSTAFHSFHSWLIFSHGSCVLHADCFTDMYCGAYLYCACVGVLSSSGWPQELVRDIKESCCRVSETAVETRASLDSIPSTSYELPDGRTIEIGADRFAVPELLFQPTLMDTSDVVRFMVIGLCARAAAGASDCEWGRLT
jgi:hypothetical protein